MLLPASSVAVNVQQPCSCQQHRQESSQKLFDRHLAAVVRGRSVVKNQVVRALGSVVGWRCQFGAVVSSNVIVCVADVLLPASSVAVNVRTTV